MKKILFIILLLLCFIGDAKASLNVHSLSLSYSKKRIKAGDTFSLDIYLENSIAINNAYGMVFTQEIDNNLEITGVTLADTSGATDFTSNILYKDDNGNLLPRMVIEYGNPGNTLTSKSLIATMHFRVKDNFSADIVSLKFGAGNYKNEGEEYSSYLTYYSCENTNISSCTFTTEQLNGIILTLPRALDFKPGSWSGEEGVVAGPTDLVKYRKYLAGHEETVIEYMLLSSEVQENIDLSGNDAIDLTDLIMLRLQLAGAATNNEICSTGPNNTTGTIGQNGYISCGSLDLNGSYVCNYYENNIQNSITCQS